MKRFIALVISLSMLSLAVAGCASTPPTAPLVPTVADTAATTAPVGAEVSPLASESIATVCDVENPNFLLLISDEANDIGDFSELWVLISGVGFVLGDEEGIEETIFETPVEVNLVGLTADAAIALWEGYVPEGDYTRVFIYVDDVWGTSVSSPEPIEIKLPSNKLQLAMPVTVDGQEPTEFVFDITVLRAGNSGQYILKPQITESGQGVAYRLLDQTRERVRLDRPDGAGTGNGNGKPEDTGTGNGQSTGTPSWASKPDWAGNPDWARDDAQDEDNGANPGRPSGAGRPDGAGKPV